MFKPSRSLNNKGMILGLEVQDLVFLVLSLYPLKIIIPLNDFQVIHLIIVFIEAVSLSFIRLNFRKGFLYSFILGKILNLSDKVKYYVNK